MAKNIKYSSRKPSVLLTLHFLLKYLGKLTMQKKKPWAVSSCAFLIREVLMKPSVFRTRERKGQSFRTWEKLLLPLILREESISGTLNEKKIIKGLRKSNRTCGRSRAWSSQSRLYNTPLVKLRKIQLRKESKQAKKV